MNTGKLINLVLGVALVMWAVSMGHVLLQAIDKLGTQEN